MEREGGDEINEKYKREKEIWEKKRKKKEETG